MTPELRFVFSKKFWHRDFVNHDPNGASGVNGTAALRTKILDLFRKRNITSIFDAGCNDCSWMSEIIPYVQYSGGDISETLIELVRGQYPDINVCVHDITENPIPAVDLLFSRDVTIHLNNYYKMLFWKNWYASNVPLILTTHVRECDKNIDFEHDLEEFPFAEVNWEIDPWNFPAPLEALDEYNNNKPGGRCLGLWHRDQFKGIL